MLYLSKGQVDELIEHSKKEAPNEACGILAGKSVQRSTFNVQREENNTERITNNVKRVTKIYQMTNTDKSSQTFFMDPKEQLRVMKEIRNLDLEMIGIYHSHVASQAYPSAHDVELAFYPEALYVIVSLKDKNNPRIRAFRIVEGKIREEEVKVADS